MNNGHGGVTLWLTGLPCSGKTTIAEILERELSVGGKARNAAMLKLREAVRATQPMWRAEPGRGFFL